MKTTSVFRSRFDFLHLVRASLTGGRLPALSIAAIIAVCHTAMAADTATSAWSGSSNSTWSDTGNWVGGASTNATISALFNSTFSNQPALTANATSQGIWLATGAGQNVTIDSGSAQTLTLTGNATLNAQTNAGIYLNDSGNHNLTIGPNTSILLSNNTGFYNQQASGTLTISGPLNLNAKTLTIGGSGAVTIGNTINGGNGVAGAGPITINNTGLTTLGGSNTSNGTLTLGNGSNVKTTNAGALGTGSITSGNSFTLTLASGATTTTANAISFTQNGVATEIITLDAPSSQAGYTQTFGATGFGQQGNLILNQTSNLTTIGTVAFGASTFGSPNSSKNTQFTPNGVNMNISSLTAVTSTTQTNVVILDGTSTGNTIGVIANGTLDTAAITKQNTSTWTFTGNNTYTGATTVNGGTLTFKNTGTGITQTLAGNLTLAGADVTLQSNNAGTGNLSTTFNALVARAAGNTGNVQVTGANNTVKFTTAPVLASGIIDKGVFYNGADWASYNGTTGVVAFDYSTGAGAVNVNLAGDQASWGATTSASNVQLSGTGNITNQTSGVNTLKIVGSRTITFGGQVQENGLLQTGGNSTITGGNLKANATNGEIVIRVDGSSDALNIASQIQANGTGTLTKSGAGTLILGGNNTVTGALTINGGVVQLNNAGALNSTAGSQMPVAFGAAGTGALALNGNSVVIGNLNSNTTVPGTATVENASGSGVTNATLTVGNSLNSSGTFAGTLQDGTGGGTLSLTKAGTGTLTLTGTNTYTGNTAINAGALSINSTGALPGWNTNGRYSVAGGATLVVTNAVAEADIATMLGTTNFAAGAAIGFDTTSASRTVNSSITNTSQGALGLNKIGANTLVLGGTNTYTGVSTVGGAVTGGTLQANSAAALGGTAGQINVVFGTINFAASTSSGTGIPTISLSTTNGLMTVNSGVTVNNPITLGGGSQNIIAGPATGTGTVAGNITWTSGQSVRFDSGGGTLALNGTITGTDATQSIMFNRSTAGTIILGATANYTAGASWTGTYGSNTPIATVIYNGTVKLAAANALAPNANLTFANSAATLDLNGNALNAGWAYQGSNGVPTRYGIITNTAASTTAALSFNVTSDNYNSSNLDGSSAYQVLSAAINDGGVGKVVSLEKKGGSTLTLINDGTYSGGTTVTAGTLAAYKGSALGTGNIALNSGTLNINYNAFANAQSSASNALTDTQSSTLTFGGGNLTVTGRPNNSAGTIIGSTSNAGGGNPANGRVLTLTSGNTAALAVGQSVTGTSIAGTNYIAMIIDNTHVLLSGGSTAGTTAQTNTLGSVTNTTSQTYGGAVFNSAGTVTVANNGGGGTTLTFGGLSGTGSLTKAGDGTLVVNGANTFSGTTKVSAGTLTIGNNAALQSSAIDTSGAGGINVTGFTTPTFGGLSGSTNLASVITTGYGGVSSLTLNPGNGATNSYSGIIADGAAGMTLTKSGAGTQILGGGNSFTGPTIISAGTLLLSGSGSLASGSAVSANAGTFGGAGTVNGTVAVAAGATLQGGLDSSDAATLTLANNLTLSPGSIISVGLGGDPTTHDILARTGGTWTFDSAQSFSFLDQGAGAGTTYTGIITGLAADPGVGSWTVNNGWTGSFNYNSGNIDFLLTAVPEPKTWLLVGIGLTFLLYRKRGRKDP